MKFASFFAFWLVPLRRVSKYSADCSCFSLTFENGSHAPYFFSSVDGRICTCTTKLSTYDPFSSISISIPISNPVTNQYDTVSTRSSTISFSLSPHAIDGRTLHTM